MLTLYYMAKVGRYSKILGKVAKSTIWPKGVVHARLIAGASFPDSLTCWKGFPNLHEYVDTIGDELAHLEHREVKNEELNRSTRTKFGPPRKLSWKSLVTLGILRCRTLIFVRYFTTLKPRRKTRAERRCSKYLEICIPHQSNCDYEASSMPFLTVRYKSIRLCKSFDMRYHESKKIGWLLRYEI